MRATIRLLSCLMPSRRSTAISSWTSSLRACTRSVWLLQAAWRSCLVSSAGILVVAPAYVYRVASVPGLVLTIFVSCSSRSSTCSTRCLVSRRERATPSHSACVRQDSTSRPRLTSCSRCWSARPSNCRKVCIPCQAVRCVAADQA